MGSPQKLSKEEGKNIAYNLKQNLFMSTQIGLTTVPVRYGAHFHYL